MGVKRANTEATRRQQEIWYDRKACVLCGARKGSIEKCFGEQEQIVCFKDVSKNERRRTHVSVKHAFPKERRRRIKTRNIIIRDASLIDLFLLLELNQTKAASRMVHMMARLAN